MVINRVPGHPPWPEFGMHLPTISPEVLPCPKGFKINEILHFSTFVEGHKVAKIIYIAIYSPIVTMVNIALYSPW